MSASRRLAQRWFSDCFGTGKVALVGSHKPIVEKIPARVESWRRHLNAANLSPKTIGLYTKAATKLASWLEGTPVGSGVNIY